MKHVAEVIVAEETIRHRLDAPQLTVGSSQDASITLPDPELSAELLVLTPHPEACTVTRIQGARGEVKVDGQSFERGDLPWGSELQVGAARLRLVAEQAREGVSPVLLVGAVASLGLLLWSFGDDAARASILEQKPEPPVLFAGVSECPEKNAAALHRAQRLEEAALARADRAPFDPGDGMAAANRFALAQACYAEAGKGDEARRLARQRDVWKQRMERRYQTLRLRLRLALTNRQSADALREIGRLEALLETHDDDAYVAWLRQLERRLRLVVEQEQR